MNWTRNGYIYECKHRYKMTTSLSTLSKPRNQFHPPRPPPLQSSINGKLTKEITSLGKSTNGFFKGKGMQTQAYKNGEIFFYNLFTLKFYPPPMFHNISIYRPSIEMKGQIESFPDIWKAKNQFICYLMGKTPNIFIF